MHCHTLSTVAKHGSSATVRARPLHLACNARAGGNPIKHINPKDPPRRKTVKRSAVGCEDRPDLLECRRVFQRGQIARVSAFRQRLNAAPEQLA